MGKIGFPLGLLYIRWGLGERGVLPSHLYSKKIECLSKQAAAQFIPGKLTKGHNEKFQQV